MIGVYSACPDTLVEFKIFSNLLSISQPNIECHVAFLTMVYLPSESSWILYSQVCLRLAFSSSVSWCLLSPALWLGAEGKSKPRQAQVESYISEAECELLKILLLSLTLLQIYSPQTVVSPPLSVAASICLCPYCTDPSLL